GYRRAFTAGAFHRLGFLRGHHHPARVTQFAMSPGLALASASYSGGSSNESGSRNPRVFHTPKAMPVIIQIAPTIMAGVLKLSHSPRQIKKPSNGGSRFQIFLSWARTKYRISAATFTPMKAINAPKFSNSAPRPYDRKKAPMSTMAPTKKTLF